MKKTTRWVGMDVHAETISIAVAEKDGIVHFVGTIPNQPDAVRRALKKLEKGGHQLRACSEAGPTGTDCTGSSPRWASSVTSSRRR